MLFIGLGATVWKVGQQPIVTLSSAESELIQMGMAIQDAKHLRSILDGLGFPKEVVRLYEDNQAAIQIAENPCQRTRVKHLGRRFMFIREAVENDEVALFYIPTNLNLADIFTKPLSHQQFIFLRNILLGYEGYLPQ